MTESETNLAPPSTSPELAALQYDVTAVIQLLRARFGEFNRDFSVVLKDLGAPAVESPGEVADKKIAAAKSQIKGILEAL